MASDDLDAQQFSEMAASRVTNELSHPDLNLFLLSFAFSRTATQFARHVESHVHRPSGLTWAGFRILFTVWVCGSMESNRVAHFSGLSRASVSSALKTLERDELITRKSGSSDRRVVLVGLTDKGEIAVKDAYSEQHRVEKDFYGSLTDKERETLTELIEKILFSSVEEV
ncbi:MAG TPA: MarR family transcriptional regulator [Acidimicrobiales bacterium]|nr:MarR family transcriptional regulator [Acidimicrobiales bacterium]